MGTKPVLKSNRSLSESEIPKAIPSTKLIREKILALLYIKKHMTYEDLQKELKEIMEKYEYSGFGVYSEVMDMVNQGLLKVNAEKIDNKSKVELAS